MSLRHPSFIEPLESRIAPASIVINAGQLGNPDGNAEYVDATASEQFFVKTSAPALQTGTGAHNINNTAVSNIVGYGDPLVPQPLATYFVVLSKGDQLNVFDSGSGYTSLIKVTSGNVVAFFVDKNSNNNVDVDELTGLSLGKSVTVSVSGNVDGDIVSNLNDSAKDVAQWTLGATGGLAEHDLLLNPLTKLSVAGNVTGSIMAGGAITNLSVVGKVSQVLAGTAANAASFDFLKSSLTHGVAGTTSPVSLTVDVPAPGKAGVAISSLVLGSVGKIQAGNGGAGAAGGSLTNITLQADTTGLTLKAGDGGAGVSSKTAGGIGGNVSSVTVQGLSSQSFDATPNDNIVIQSGNGGDAFSTGNGGKAGSVSKIYVGYDTDPAGKLKQSVNPLLDAVTVQSGEGGDGKSGGAGGSVSSVFIYSSPTRAGNDIQVVAGNGGASTVAVASGAKGGAGGSLTTVEARNINSRESFDFSSPLSVTNGSNVVGGTGLDVAQEYYPSTTDATKKYPDATTKLQVGDAVSINGLVFHVAGSITPTSFLLDGNYTGTTDPAATGEVVQLTDSKVVVRSGSGGNVVSPGTGGNGGSVTGAKLLGYNLQALAGSGSAGSAGSGIGGSLKTITIESLDDGSANGIKARILSADAGSGAGSSAGKGGAGGSIDGVTLTNSDLVYLGINQLAGSANGGTGGKGVGGAGGAVSNLKLFGIIDPASKGNNSDIKIRSGAGGDGSSTGGAGGNVSSLQVLLQNANLEVTSGGGGKSTSSGAGGKGGNIATLAASSSGFVNPGEATSTVANKLVDSNATFIQDGIKVGDVVNNKTGGTSAVVTSVISETELSLGSDIFASTDSYSFPTKTAVQAGVGGAGMLAGAGGAGGSITNANLIFEGNVLVSAGNGGNGGATGASGAGGAVGGSSVSVGTHETSKQGRVEVKAGDAGAVGSKPGAGGIVGQTGIAANLDIMVTAGNGANGGIGGNITSLGFSNPSGAGPSHGSTTVLAGTGSGASAVGSATAGAGGSITGVTGYVGDTGLTLIKAGKGGSADKKATAGGSVSNVNIYAGGGDGVVVNIEAGDATNSASASVGGAGGSVKTVSILGLESGTVLRHIAAGNGGNTSLATGKGGVGGSIDTIYVNHDIGVRSGEAFGYDKMGGLFAGSGGINTTVPGRTAQTLDPKLDGAAGNVTNITAYAIAAIVAGKPDAGSTITKQNLVTKADNIMLASGTEPVHRLHVNSVGTITNSTLKGSSTDEIAGTDTYQLLGKSTDVAPTPKTLVDTSAQFITNGVHVGDTVQNTTVLGFSTVVSVESETKLTLSSSIFTTNGQNYKIDAPANKLIDAAAHFVTDKVSVGDVVRNITNGTEAKVLTVDSETQLTLSSFIFFDAYDAYDIPSEMIDSTAKFITNGVKVGDVVRNITEGTEAKVLSVDSETQLTLDKGIFETTGDFYNLKPNQTSIGFVGAVVIPTMSVGGTDTAVAAGKLIDSAAKFKTNGIYVGQTVTNRTDGTNATVVSVDDETHLTLSANIFAAVGKTYDFDIKGAASSTTANQLVDASADFIAQNVNEGDIVRNLSSGTFAKVVSVDSDTQLTLSANIFTAGNNYDFGGVAANYSSNSSLPNTTHPHANTFDLIANGSAVNEYIDSNGDGTFGIGDKVNNFTDGFIAAISLTSKRNFVPEALLTVNKTGTNTTLASNELIDSTAKFLTDGVYVGQTIKNLATSKTATVVSVVSQTELTLTSNIFTVLGKNYSLEGTSNFIDYTNGLATP